METPLRLIAVEDSELDTTLLIAELKRSGYRVDHMRVDTPEGLREALAQGEWDIVISDHKMPRFSAPEALAILKESSPDLPMIILSGEIDLNLAVSLLKDGARDYIHKSEIARVPPAVQRELEDARAKREQEEELALYHQELQAINRIVTTAAEARSLRVTLDKLIEEALQIVGIEGGTICMVTPENTLMLAAHRATSEATIIDLTTNEIRVGDCLCGWCARDKTPLILPDREAVLKFATREATRGEDIRFHAAFPLIAEDRCVGVLCVFTRTDRKPTERSLKLLETVTLQIAFVIERARLFEEIQRNAGELERRVAERTSQLEAANKELEAFSYSVSHDLRSPLRHIDGFSRILSDEFAQTLDDKARDYIEVIRTCCNKMSGLIDSLLKLSRITRAEMSCEEVDLSRMVESIAGGLADGDPERKVGFVVPKGLTAKADARLMQVALENIIGNAWKFTAGKEKAEVEFGMLLENGERVFFVKDNGAGFDTAYARKLFSPFQRLHTQEEFEGVGVGLATVQRIIHRHGGRIWADSQVGEGATFYFTLP